MFGLWIRRTISKTSGMSIHILATGYAFMTRMNGHGIRPNGLPILLYHGLAYGFSIMRIGSLQGNGMAAENIRETKKTTLCRRNESLTSFVEKRRKSKLLPLNAYDFRKLKGQLNKEQ